MTSIPAGAKSSSTSAASLIARICGGERHPDPLPESVKDGTRPARLAGAVEGGERPESLQFSTDTRSIRPGQVFVALQGDNFDGHNFIAKALGAGAAGLVVSRDRYDEVARQFSESTAPPFIVPVGDTLHALGELARHHRLCHQIPVVGITGSCGKTTTRQLIAAALEAGPGNILATTGNMNNLVGVPLTLFNLSSRHRGAVIEMGINMHGEMERLVHIVRPTIATITNVHASHTEGLGGVEGVARAKGKIFHHLNRDAVAVVNADDPLVTAQYRSSGHRGRCLTFGTSAGADVRLLHPRTLPDGVGGVMGLEDGTELPFRLSLLGGHNLLNAACALACAMAAGVDPQVGLAAMAHVKPVGRRLAVKMSALGFRVIDDTYNANGASVMAALDVLMGDGAGEAGTGRRIAVLGDMLELGEQAKEWHARVGSHAALRTPDLLLTVGPLASTTLAETARREGLGDRVLVCRDHQEALRVLRQTLTAGDLVLVKASRGVGLDRVVDGLLQEEPGAEDGQRERRAQP